MTAPLDRAELHRQLDQLLDQVEANGERPDMDRFWAFVQALGHGRGIADQIHEEALTDTRDSEWFDLDKHPDRAERIYHIWVLLNFLKDNRASLVLPRSFNSEAIQRDLTMMLEGPGGLGAGKPQLLYSNREGLNPLKEDARRALVLAIHYRAGKQGKSVAEIRRQVLLVGDQDEEVEVPESTWQDWVKEVGRGDAKTAQAAGKAGDEATGFDRPDEELKALATLAWVRKDRDGK